MAVQLEWKDRHDLGVEKIDKEHRKLFRIINRLRAFSGEEEDKTSWVYQEAVKYFKSYALKHFSEEEAYMASVSYQERAIHKRLHEDFRCTRLPALEEELEEEKYSMEAITHLRGICTSWLIDHIQIEDQAIVGRGISKWVNLLPAESVEEVKETLSGLLNEMFGQEPKVISNCYGGEEFGEGIYYRVIYGTQEGEKQEVILIFEKKLLVKILEKLEEDPVNRSGVTMVEAIQSVEKQLEDMKEHFSSEEKYDLKGENQLSYEQFQRALQRQLPKFSLLLDTGEGYFGYCAMTPHFLRGADTKKEEPAKEAEEAKDGKAAGKAAGATGKEAKAEARNGKAAGKAAGATGKEAKAEARDGKAAGKAPEGAGKAPGATGKAAQSPNAMAAGSQDRKKVLVVDDSEMVRQVMKGLLQKEYKVSVAKSGIAAIRAMTLERPDLILLDYNMPVCDGALLLQMIRSEEDFADISVIFLTATIDKASVKRVVPLKPEGYLLKSMKPIEIKKRIDGFFARKEGSR